MRIFKNIDKGSETVSCTLICKFIKSITTNEDDTRRDITKVNKPLFNIFLPCYGKPTLKKQYNEITKKLGIIYHPYTFVEDQSIYLISDKYRIINNDFINMINYDSELIDNFLLLLFEYAYNNINSESIDHHHAIEYFNSYMIKKK